LRIASTSTMFTSLTTGLVGDSLSSKTSMPAPSARPRAPRRSSRRDLRHHLGHRRLPGLVVLLDRLADRRLRRHHRQDLQARHEGDVVEREHVRRVRHRQREGAPIRLTGRTSYLRRSARARGAASRVDVDVAQRDGGMPYWRERKPISCSSVMKLRRARIEPSFSVLPFCSASACLS